MSGGTFPQKSLLTRRPQTAKHSIILARQGDELKNSPVDCFSRGEDLQGRPLLSALTNLHPAGQAGIPHPSGDDQSIEFALCFNPLRNFFHAKQATVAGVKYPSLIQSGTKWSEPRELGAQALRRSGANPANRERQLAAESGAAACRRIGSAGSAPALDEFALTDFMRRNILSANKVYSREGTAPHSFRAERSGANPASG